MKIGLVHSPNQKFSSTQNFGLLFAPIWAYQLSTYIKDFKHEPVLFDLNTLDLNAITNCDIFFFSGINQDLESIITSAKYVKQKFNKKMYIGGPITWSLNQANELKSLDIFDYICIGDGELLINEIFKFKSLNRIIEVKDRFDMHLSKPIDKDLLTKNAMNYYGGVIEVSRGCPFLCEFCDIRILPNNNQNHSRNIDTIIKDLDIHRKNNVKNIQLACDNFIGDLNWARELVEEIIKYNKKYNWEPSFYTWLTINLSKYPDLLKKMRIAGFDNLFIGVESFNNNSLIETAKMQNTKKSVIDCIRTIQSYGFVVVAGLIFGFDSDDDKSFNETLDGIQQSGLISGDASLLTALPGTPLYRRIKLSDRLRPFNETSFLGGFKYETNIKYLLDKKLIINGYIKFTKKYLSCSFQFKRLMEFYKIIDNDNYINVQRSGYTDIYSFIKKIFRDIDGVIFIIKKLIPLLRPDRFLTVLLALIYILDKKIRKKINTQYFIFWLFIWVNAIAKYSKIKSSEFNIESVGEDYDINKILPVNYFETHTEQIPINKIKAQFKNTSAQLIKIIERKTKM